MVCVLILIYLSSYCSHAHALFHVTAFYASPSHYVRKVFSRSSFDVNCFFLVKSTLFCFQVSNALIALKVIDFLDEQ